MKKRAEWVWDLCGQALRQEIHWMDAHQQILTRWLGRVGAKGRPYDVRRLVPGAARYAVRRGRVKRASP